MALSTNQAVGAATLQKAKLKRQQGGMAQAPQTKPAARPMPARPAPPGMRQPPPFLAKPQSGMSAGSQGSPPGATSLTAAGPVASAGAGGGDTAAYWTPERMAQANANTGGSGGPAAFVEDLRPGSGPGGIEPGMQAPSMPQPGGQDLMRLLPPKMQAAMAQNGRDPREAIASRMANDETFRQKMVAMQQQGGFLGAQNPSMSLPMQPPPQGPQIDPAGGAVQKLDGPPSGIPDSPVSAVPGQAQPGGPMRPLPPGADIGGPMPPPGPQSGPMGMDPQRLRQMLPPAMQSFQGAQGAGGQATSWPMLGAMAQQGGFQGNPQGLNLQSLQAQMQGGGPAPGAQPQLGGVNPYRGL